MGGMADNLKKPEKANGPLLIRDSTATAPDGNYPDSNQYFDWGYVHWLIEANPEKSRRVSVGEICFYPDWGEPEHSHFGEEQILHVVSGEGVHTVNGKSMPLKQGETVYIPPYSRHVLVNASNQNHLNILAIYVHSHLNALFNTVEFQPPNIDYKNFDLNTTIDTKVVGRLLDKLSSSLNFSMWLLDKDGHCLIESEYLNPFCRRLRACGNHCLRNIQKAINGMEPIPSAHIISCCSEVHSLFVPIISENTILGYIKCGEFYLVSNGKQVAAKYLSEISEGQTQFNPEEIGRLTASLVVEKRSRLYSTSEAIKGVADYIAENSMALARQRELDKTRLSVAEEQVVTATLEKALKEADFKLLQSQINPHFLFNTLNVLSQIAYMEGADKTAALVCSLSGLMRATLRKSQVLVPLTEEISLVNDYLSIQAARFGDRLKATVEVEDGLGDIRIPILILQPLVENVIVHAVETSFKTCSLSVRVQRQNGGLISLSVSDNGPGFSESQDAHSPGSGLGLSSIRARLKHFFNGQFTFDLDNRPGLGVEVKITIPESLSHEFKNNGG